MHMEEKLIIMASFKTSFEFNFAGNKTLKVVFFLCDWFDSNNGIGQSQHGITEVKHKERLRGHDNFILAH
jgi:hypothetical protein